MKMQNFMILNKKKEQLKMKIIEDIKTFLINLDNDTLKKLWNNYCNDNSYDDYIYDMDEFDDIMDGCNPSDIASKCYYGSFNPNNDYFVFDGCGNLRSTNFVDSFISIDDLAQHIFDNDDDLGDDDLRDFLDEEDEEDDE